MDVENLILIANFYEMGFLQCNDYLKLVKSFKKIRSFIYYFVTPFVTISLNELAVVPSIEIQDTLVPTSLTIKYYQK